MRVGGGEIGAFQAFAIGNDLLAILENEIVKRHALFPSCLSLDASPRVRTTVVLLGGAAAFRAGGNFVEPGDGVADNPEFPLDFLGARGPGGGDARLMALFRLRLQAPG